MSLGLYSLGLYSQGTKLMILSLGNTEKDYGGGSKAKTFALLGNLIWNVCKDVGWSHSSWRYIFKTEDCTDCVVCFCATSQDPWNWPLIIVNFVGSFLEASHSDMKQEHLGYPQQLPNPSLAWVLSNCVFTLRSKYVNILKNHFKKKILFI